MKQLKRVLATELRTNNFTKAKILVQIASKNLAKILIYLSVYISLHSRIVASKILDKSQGINGRLLPSKEKELKFFQIPWKPFKNDKKMLFISPLKLFLFSRFLPWLFVHVEKTAWLEKDQVNFKTYDVITWLTSNNIHILHIISQSKANKTMEFVQLLAHNRKNNFIQELWRKWSREISSRPLFVF